MVDLQVNKEKKGNLKMMAAQPVDNLSRSVQDYLKAIYSQTRDGQPTSTLRLADALAVAPASVSNMLQKLDESTPRMIEYRKHRGVTLTRDGTEAALKIIRRHRLLEQFLFQVMGYPWDRVHAEAEELEHVISPYFEDRLADLLDEPAFDPHGEPIPDRQLLLAEHLGLVGLSELQPGQSGAVRQVAAESDQLLAYLGSVGVHPGVRLQVFQRNPIDGALRVKIEGQSEEAIFSREISQAVWISLE